MKTIAAVASMLVVLTLTLPVECNELKAPKTGKIKVAFVMTNGATMIDFAGPWEVFQDVHVPDRGESMDDVMPFQLYTVSESRKPIRTSGGMQVIPDYTFEDAPMPDVVVVGAQRGSKELTPWLRKVAPHADVIMSICTGAFRVARAGLFDGKSATTHHDFFEPFEKEFEKVELVRGRRFVEADEKVSSAGGLTSGIDLALHVVSRYFGDDVAATTAAYMEYESESWRTGNATKTTRNSQ